MKNIFRIIACTAFMLMSIFGETERTASLMWFLALMVYYAICRIEDIAKYIGESK